MKALYDKVSAETSKRTTQTYSTSFSIGIKLLDKRFHQDIYSIYGFVRLADEVVDSFHGFNKEKLIAEIRQKTFEAIEEGISVNPILHSFQETVRKYNIPLELIDTFLASMEMDLEQKEHDRKSYETYILGSAEVVGLMCLMVFCEGDLKKHEELKPSAMSLGATFQKINFLRDLNADFDLLGRNYFPGIDLTRFNEQEKQRIEKEIELDFVDGLSGIKQLPKGARLGVYVAYVYYYNLFQKIKSTPSSKILKERIRVPNPLKFLLLFKSYVKFNLNAL